MKIFSIRPLASAFIVSLLAAVVSQGQTAADLGYLGDITVLDDNWIHHPSWGATYVVPNEGASAFLMVPDGTWFWTNEAVFPFVWDFEMNTWLYGVGTDVQREWFFNYATLLWERGSITAGPVEDLSAELAPILSQRNLPSMAAAIFVNGRLAARGVAGVRRRGGDTPVTINDLYHMGSLTKSMTATLAARFVERGEISWTTTMAEIYPDMTGMHETWKNTTLEQLLSHTSGAVANVTTSSDRWWLATEPIDEQRRTIVQEVTATAPPHPQGGYLYSNTGFIMAGAMLEEITGQTWEDLIQQELFGPRNIDSVGFGAPGTPGADDQPLQHRADSTVVEPDDMYSDNAPPLGPAGRVHMTVTDLAQFAALHSEGPWGLAGDFLPPAQFNELHSPRVSPPGYALGWINEYYSDMGEGSIWHNGSNTYNYATIIVAPEHHIAAAAVTNIGHNAANQAVEQFIAAKVRAYIAAE